MVVRSDNPSLWVTDNRLNNSLVGPTGAEQQSGGNNGGGIGGVLDTLNDGLSVYERLRCQINPNARGCYTQSDTTNSLADNQNQTMLMIGLGVVILLVIVVVVIALKK